MTDYTDTREVPVGGHETQHGRPASWVLVGIIIAAFVAGGFAIIYRQWWLFWLCVGIVVLSVPTGKIIGIMDDTVKLDDSPRALPPTTGVNSAADPGVRLD